MKILGLVMELPLPLTEILTLYFRTRNMRICNSQSSTLRKEGMVSDPILSCPTSEFNIGTLLAIMLTIMRVRQLIQGMNGSMDINGSKLGKLLNNPLITS